MNVVVVLHEPQDLVNIAVVIRAMLNFGQRELRLVSPAEFDATRMEGIAHKAGELIRRTERCATLDQALADCTHVVGLTARGRGVKRNVQRPEEAAVQLAAMSPPDRPAVVLGREDKGLSNDDLDRCHRIVTIPTTGRHSSINLGQAATVMLYELYKAAAAADFAFKRPRRQALPATRELLEQLFADAEQALWAVDFFKARNPEHIMRTARELVHRTPLDAREAGLIRSMCLEVVRYLERMGIRS